MRPRVLITAVLVGVVLVLAFLGLTQAVRDQPARTPDVVASEVANSLRCPTCQGLSVADSSAPMAEGMREIIIKQAEQGRTPDEIRQYFVDRYGAWILLSPRREGIGWVVWLLPAAAVTVGVGLALRAARRRRKTDHVGEAELELARGVYANHLADRYVPDDTPAGERVEAALELLASIDEDHAPDDGSARDGAMQRLAGALAASEADEAPTPVPEVDDATDADPPAPTRSRRRWPVYGLAAAFVAVLTVLLISNLGGRGPDGLPTGLLAQETPSADVEAQIEALRAEAREQPDDPDAWLTLGKILDEVGRLGDAYTAYERALELDPDNAEPRQLAAWALIRGEVPDEAIPLVEPLVANDPDDARSVLLLGLAQYGADDPAATATLRRYLALEPTGPQSDQIRALLGATSPASPEP